MAERTSYPHGTFGWVEVATPRQEEAKAFLSELFGWEFDDMPVDDSTVYSMGFDASESAAGTRWTIVNGDRQNGGILEMNDQFPAGIPAN
jgi:predicted enzyme related to lactoylglutathione lyase